LSYQLPHWVWPVALMVVCAIAVVRGRDRERLAAGGLLAAWALSMVVYKARSEATQWPILFIDLGFFSLLTWMALRSGRFWPMFAAGFQLLALITHLAHAVDVGVSGWAYITAERIWSYLVLFTIGYAAWTAPRYAESAADPTEVPPGAMRR
jgi:hypothetical protein